MEVYLSRQSNGLYMLTEMRPVVATVNHSDNLDLYVPYGPDAGGVIVGDPIGLRNFCKNTLWMFGQNPPALRRLESTQIELSARLISSLGNKF